MTKTEKPTAVVVKFGHAAVFGKNSNTVFYHGRFTAAVYGLR